MEELKMWKEYTGQEIIDWVSANPNHDISVELTRKYYKFDEEWFDFECNINPERKYKIHDYVTDWYLGSRFDNRYRILHTTYQILKVHTEQPRRSSLKKGEIK
jgi:hypothetical protein